jgi:hypothetical protein
MSIKLGKDKIEQLIRKAAEKYKGDTGEEIIVTQTPSNYSGLANKLTEKAKELPSLDPQNFKIDTGIKNLDPYDKYTITPAQVRDAYYGKVDSLKEHFYEACHLYLYNKLSKDCKKEFFEKPLPPNEEPNPILDPAPNEEPNPILDPAPIKEPDPILDPPPIKETEPIIHPPTDYKKRNQLLLIASAILLVSFLFVAFKWYTTKRQFDTIKKDMKILPYKPTEAEISSLAGVWKVTTGSPQARTSDSNRYHMTVSNIMEVKYKNGYFIFTRYGPSFNQIGYIQFEAPNLISIHSYFKNDSNIIVTPKHTLLKLESGKTHLNAISASWSFDPEMDIIIGIREVFTKLGKGGTIKIIENAKENVRWPGYKILHWIQENNKVDSIRLKNEFLDTLPATIHKLIDENSILLNDPDSTVLQTKKREGRGAGE